MLTVLMATCNGASTLPAVLDGYCALQAPDAGWSLLVVDDGSTDATAAILVNYSSRLPLRVLRQPRRGKNSALNNALSMVLSDTGHPRDLIVFTDDDATPMQDWLRQLAQCAAAHEHCSLFGGAIVAEWGAQPPDWLLRLIPLGVMYGVTTAGEGPVFPGLIWGANMAVRRAVFDAGYRFDPAVGPRAGCYPMGSETEFTRRVAKAGFRAWFCSAACVRHSVRPHQMTIDYLLARAFRYGRGARLQEIDDGAPRLFGAPRWMLARYALGILEWCRAACRGDKDRIVQLRWDLAYWRGFLHQSWFGRPRKVLITSCSGELGGMELRMAQEARILQGAGWCSTVATPRFKGSPAFLHALRRDGIGTAVFHAPQFFEQWAWRRLKLLRARLFTQWRLRLFRADLVHVAFCWTSYGASLLWLASCTRLPAVVSVHNAFPPEQISQWHAPLYRQAFANVRGVYAVSHSAMRHFMDCFGALLAPGCRFAVIPNSVDTARFVPSAARRARARAQLGLSPDALVIGAVARLSPQKRPDALLDLFIGLRQRFAGLRLVYAGTGPLEASIKARVAALGLNDAVIFTGHVDAVEELLPALDLHLLLSRNEGFGIATIEAMACGVPAVGTDVPGNVDVLAHSRGGMLVPLHDPIACRDLVAALLADAPRRAQMAEAGRAEVKALYSSAMMAQRVRAFYGDLSL